jgi:hypothetical protein
MIQFARAAERTDRDDLDIDEMDWVAPAYKKIVVVG